MPHIHPVVVHFPIALLTAALLLDAVGIFLKNPVAVKAGWWIFLAGTLTLGLAVGTGLLGKSDVIIPPDAADPFNVHEQIAFVAAGIFSVLLLWRIGSRTAIPAANRWVFLGIYLVGVIVCWVGGLYGGELVYRHAVGVQGLMH
jgi:uncharacterized membrane protein